MEKNIEVGQILYLIQQDSCKIIPVLVIEQITNKSIFGEKKSYRVSYDHEYKNTDLLENIKSEIFYDIDTMTKELIDRSKKSILNVIDNVKEKANIFLKNNNSNIVNNNNTITDNEKIEDLDDEKNKLIEKLFSDSDSNTEILENGDDFIARRKNKTKQKWTSPISSI